MGFNSAFKGLIDDSVISMLHWYLHPSPAVCADASDKDWSDRRI